ncbi:rod shape-determining protein MreD [Candidatus Thiothrix anitrata]|jgi:rod shape-determining protein MreD|uniref:Rod shape-determining protein MreD n=1 Tax=Candidatus Thiothrix anitrata TaxID=2823902 RepID=A0ABX7X876_9GAMM|nr:rod shape-determining protein MreD [Candidatus Thiothrix anitrata]QTR50580.1 rod shape-determining protein MreD [Candidatus Thiothrix anitrata]
MNKEPRFPGAVLVTLLLAIILTIIPLSEQVAAWRPEWIALTLIHWGLVIKDRVSLVAAFVVGLIIDTLYGSILGQHALGFVLVTYLAVRLSLRMNPEAFLQQTALLAAVLFLYLLISLLIQGFTDTGVGSGLFYWASLLSSVVIWPVYHALLGYFHVQRKVI